MRGYPEFLATEPDASYVFFRLQDCSLNDPLPGDHVQADCLLLVSYNGGRSPTGEGGVDEKQYGRDSSGRRSSCLELTDVRVNSARLRYPLHQVGHLPPVSATVVAMGPCSLNRRQFQRRYSNRDIDALFTFQRQGLK
ncbi:hypothetical protein QO004_003301 [Rhizobium mesoamericanum]|nr:hypothetical protein [Rhizobium mesoamericanum]